MNLIDLILINNFDLASQENHVALNCVNSRLEFLQLEFLEKLVDYFLF